MKWIWSFMAGAIPFLFWPSLFAAGDSNENLRVFGEERYRYQAVPLSVQENQEKQVQVEIRNTGDGLEYLSRSLSPEMLEEIKIHMGPEGQMVSAERNISRPPEKKVSQERIWSEGRKVSLERSWDGHKKEKQYLIPADSRLAVDASLLLLLRSFPFDTQERWKLFMLDFLGNSAIVTAHQAGREKIAVPAGDYVCFRMEVVVDIPLLRPRILFWISVIKPHFLVKHEGKKGPFTPSYITSLVARE